MKLNKMTVIAALALGSLLTMGTVVNAQDTTTPPAATPPAGAPPGGGRGRQLSIEQLATKQARSDDQKTNVQAVLVAQRQQMRDLRNDTTLSTDDRRAKMKTIRDDANAKLKTILTPDQFAKYQALMLARRPATPPPTAAPAAN